MAQFTSYRRIGNFVIESRLDHMSNELNTTCLVYYELPDREVSRAYHLSKANPEVSINIFSKTTNYQITGKLEFHFRHFNSGEIVNIYARLNYGLANEEQNYEGVLSQIDSKKGNLLDNTEHFPNISDLYVFPDVSEVRKRDSSEIEPDEAGNADTISDDDFNPEAEKPESNSKKGEEATNEDELDDSFDGYKSLFPYLKLHHWMKVKAEDYPNDFIQYKPLVYPNKKNNVFFELLKTNLQQFQEDDDKYIDNSKSICSYWLTNQRIYWSETPAELAGQMLPVTTVTPQTPPDEAILNEAIRYGHTNDIPEPFAYFPTLYDDLCDILNDSNDNHEVNQQFEQLVYHIFEVNNNGSVSNQKKDLSLVLETYYKSGDTLLNLLNKKSKLLEGLKETGSAYKEVKYEIQFLQKRKSKSQNFKFNIDNIWQNYFLMVISNTLDTNYAVELSKIIIVSHILEQWLLFNRHMEMSSNISGIVPVVYAEIIKATIILPKLAFRKITPKVLKHTNTNWVTPFAIGQLDMVKYKLDNYEVGEIAHIENVIKGEVRTVTKRKLTNQQEVSSTSNEQIKSLSKRDEDTITDLATEIKRTLSDIEETQNFNNLEMDYSQTPTALKKGSVVTTFVNKPINTANNTASEDTNELLKQILQSTIDRISEKIAIKRSTSITNEHEETSSSTFDNKDGEKNIVSVYRWLSKRYKITLKRLRHRLLLEFELSEPAKKYKATQLGLNGVELEQKYRPAQLGLIHFTDVKTIEEAAQLEKLPTSITPTQQKNMTNAFGISDTALKNVSYVDYVTYYQVENIETPPENNQYIAEMLRSGEAMKKVVIPKDYKAVEASITVIGLEAGKKIDVAIGGLAPKTVANGVSTVSIPTALNGEIIVMIVPNTDSPTDFANNIVVAVQLKCEIDKKALNDWRIKTFKQIRKTYTDWAENYYEAETRLTERHEFSNTLIFRHIEKAELRKQCLEVLFDVVPKVEYTSWEADIYQLRYDKFFSQALDWNDMTYSFDDTPTEFTYQLKGINDSLRPFLQAKSSNLYIPVHQSYSLQLLYFLATGEIWQLPSPFVPSYSADIDIIYQYKTKSEKPKPKNKSWLIALPTTMQVVQEKDELLDVLS